MQIFTKTVVLFDIDYTLFDTAFFKQSGLSKHKTYKEVMWVLDKLSKCAILGIFSKGNLNFQKEKLKNTGLGKFFRKENVHVFTDKDINLDSVLDEYKNFKIFLVDDKLNVLFAAKKYVPSIFTIWVKRGPYAEKLQKIAGFTPDRTVVNLEQITDFVTC